MTHIQEVYPKKPKFLVRDQSVLKLQPDVQDTLGVQCPDAVTRVNCKPDKWFKF